MMTDNKPDPVLQQASQEIEAILEKHDIGGYIILASQTHGEYKLHFPKWSKAYFEGTSIRFKAKGKDKKEHDLVGATIHMIQVFQLQGMNISRGMDNLLEVLESKLIITGGPEKI